MSLSDRPAGGGVLQQFVSSPPEVFQLRHTALNVCLQLDQSQGWDKLEFNIFYVHLTTDQSIPSKVAQTKVRNVITQ